MQGHGVGLDDGSGVLPFAEPPLGGDLPGGHTRHGRAIAELVPRLQVRDLLQLEALRAFLPEQPTTGVEIMRTLRDELAPDALPRHLCAAGRADAGRALRHGDDVSRAGQCTAGDQRLKCHRAPFRPLPALYA